MAGGSATVRVTVALPTGVTANAGDEIRVYLYTPTEIDASGRVVRESSSVTRATAEFQQGQSVGTAVFQNVAAGKYILRAYTYRMSGGKIRNCPSLFFNADGSTASSEYAVTPFSVAEGQNVAKTIAIPAAETSISGVLRFSAPLSQDTEFELYCYGSGTGSTSHYVYFTGQQGATSVPFSIGLASGCYYLRFSLDDSYYLDYNGILTEEGGTHYYCHVAPGAGLSGLSVNGDILLGKTDNTETETVKVDISVTFPEALARERKFSVCAVSDNTSNSSSTVVEAGQTTFSRTLTLNKSREYVIGYRDTTDCSNMYSPKTAKDVRYLSESGGITTIYENAKKFKFTGDTSVSIREPACGRVTGRVSRNGFNAGYWAAAYAYAEFPDGERYCARVLLGTADSAEYVIYIPMTHSGQQSESNSATRAL